MATPVSANPNIDYTSKDYASLLQSMLDYAGKVMPDWNTSSPGDFGVVLLQLFAYAGDILSYYGDRISQEAFLPTATQRISLLNIADLLGYVPGNGTAATGTVNIQTEVNIPDTVLPQGTQVMTNYIANIDQPIIFELDNDETIPGFGGKITVNVTQGVTKKLISLGVSSGEPAQEFHLPELGILDTTVRLFVQTTSGNEEWSQIQFMVDADTTDKIFTVRNDDKGVTIITLGDGINGLIPPPSVKLFATYRVGNGYAGNVSAGSIGSFVSPPTGIFIPQDVDGTFQSSAMTFGSDPESIEQIRANAPLAARTQYRAVSLQDYSDLATGIPGVYLAHAVAGHSTSITLYVVAANGGAPHAQMIQEILDFFAPKQLAGVTITVSGPTDIPVNLGTSLIPVQLQVKDKRSQTTVMANVLSALQTMLSVPRVQFGMHLSVSDFYHTIMNVDGVDYVYIPIMARNDAQQAGTADIQFRDSELPIPGTFNIIPSGGIA